MLHQTAAQPTKSSQLTLVKMQIASLPRQRQLTVDVAFKPF
jgi:hypothetical protein